MKIFLLRSLAAAISAAFVVPAMAQDAPSVLRASLPRDLSPWGMFLTANNVVQIVIIGLVLASVVTWTVALAKATELWVIKRKLRGALTTLDGARSSTQAEQALGHRGPAVEFVRAAIAEEALSADGS